MRSRQFLIAIVGFVALAANNLNADEPVFTDWSSSEGKPASVRIGTMKDRLAKDEAIEVIIEMKNISKEPISLVHKPIPHPYYARLFTVKRDGSTVPCTTPEASFGTGTLRSFLLVQPGETVKQTVVIDEKNFRSSTSPGKYELTYRYSHLGYKGRAERLGVKNFFVGDIESPVLTIKRAE